ncbi:MAG: hypothetical protein FWC20_08835 [Oscillospiraceae bacterium]|nr:hypothetical protein [Oscillospiraceae bacterium]MCL2279494.1 hypothetical protein [Oscillospiraceae bacterium]
MQQAIQFNSTVESGIIRIPEQYIKEMPSNVKVTVTPIVPLNIKIGANAKAGMLTGANFSALKIDTSNWTFDREEANERS